MPCPRCPEQCPFAARHKESSVTLHMRALQTSFRDPQAWEDFDQGPPGVQPDSLHDSPSSPLRPVLSHMPVGFSELCQQSAPHCHRRCRTTPSTSPVTELYDQDTSPDGESYDVRPCSISKHMLALHLTSYTPPYIFNPFLNPPNISTSQNTKTQSTSQQPIQ